MSTDIHFQIKRSDRRKTISLQVKDSMVIITAPKRCPEQYLLELLKNKRHWIEHQQAKLKHAKLAVSKKSLHPEGILHYLGEPYTVNLITHPITQVTLDPDKITLYAPSEAHAETALLAWYHEQAQGLFLQKSLMAAAQLNKSFSGVKIAHYKSKWGSCSAQGDLRYNWLLIQAPEPVIDYIVAHEVSHLAEPHHQASFWKTVAFLCPHYIESRAWLKKYGASLHWPNT